MIVDDGVATGATAKVACQVARAQGASRVVLAVPIGADDTVERFAGYADEVVCLQTPAFFFAVGQGYRNFTTDLRRRGGRAAGSRLQGLPAVRRCSAADPPLRDEEVRVTAGPVSVAGHLTIPEHPTGIVVFAHGSGSSRHSPRNRYVAEVLNGPDWPPCCSTCSPPKRNVTAPTSSTSSCWRGAWSRSRTGWRASPTPRRCRSATSAPAPGRARPWSRPPIPEWTWRRWCRAAGDPISPGQALTKVRAPTLLIVGGYDEVVLDLNRRARSAIPGTCEIVVVPGATHLFEEPGALEQVAVLARDWFIDHLSRVGATTNP